MLSTLNPRRNVVARPVAILALLLVVLLALARDLAPQTAGAQAPPADPSITVTVNGGKPVPVQQVNRADKKTTWGWTTFENFTVEVETNNGTKRFTAKADLPARIEINLTAMSTPYKEQRVSACMNWELFPIFWRANGGGAPVLDYTWVKAHEEFHVQQVQARIRRVLAAILKTGVIKNDIWHYDLPGVGNNVPSNKPQFKEQLNQAVTQEMEKFYAEIEHNYGSTRESAIEQEARAHACAEFLARTGNELKGQMRTTHETTEQVRKDISTGQDSLKEATKQSNIAKDAASKALKASNPCDKTAFDKEKQRYDDADKAARKAADDARAALDKAKDDLTTAAKEADKLRAGMNANGVKSVPALRPPANTPSSTQLHENIKKRDAELREIEKRYENALKALEDAAAIMKKAAELCAKPSITARPQGPVLFPPVGLCAGIPTYPETYSQLSVSGTDLKANTTYDLVITGAAGGVPLDKSLGTITADAKGLVGPVLFTLPQVPGHNAWSLVATPHGGGTAAQTPLATGYTACIINSEQGEDGRFTVRWSVVGFKPETMITVTMNGTPADEPMRVGADGSLTSSFTHNCPQGARFYQAVVGTTIDSPSVTITFPTPTLACA